MSRPSRFVLFALLALGLSGITSRVASAETPPPYSFGWTSDGSSSFAAPLDLAISGDRVYVGDATKNRVSFFKRTGEFVGAWSGAPYNFDNISSIAVDDSGNVYVLEIGPNRVTKVSSAGSVLTRWGSLGTGNGQFDTPQGIGCDASGNVYVGDTNNHRIQKFTSLGGYLGQWGGPGVLNGKFFYPKKVAVSRANGLIYVSDTGNDRIQAFTTAGAYQFQWGSNGSQNGGFDRPDHVAVDATGNVYVSDLFNDRIQKFTSTGAFLCTWGPSGSAPGQLYRPSGLDVDAYGDVYVADAGNLRVQCFGSIFLDTGAGLPALSSPSLAWGDFDNDGDLDLLLTGTSASGSISRVYRNTAGVFTDLAAGLPPVTGGDAQWADVDNDGDLDIVIAGSGLFQVYRNNGNGTFTNSGAVLPGFSSVAIACGDFDQDGWTDLLVNGYPGSGSFVAAIYHNNGDGSFTNMNAGLTGLDQPSIAGAPVACYDYDRDGLLDALVGGKVYHSNGNGTFALVTTVSAGSTHQLAVSDQDGDGLLDLWLGSNAFFRNLGNGSFPSTGVSPAPPFDTVTPCAASADLDNDGRVDYVLGGLAGAGSVCRVISNDRVDLAVGLAALRDGKVAIGDYDQDGHLDLVLAGTQSVSTTTTRLYRGGYGIQNPPTTMNRVYAYNASVSGTKLRITWTGNGSVHYPFGVTPVTYDIRVGTTANGMDLASVPADPLTGLRRVAALGALTTTSYAIDLARIHRNPHYGIQMVDYGLKGGAFTDDTLFVLGAGIASVNDLPGDQGGWLRITFAASPLDVANAATPATTYGVWRHIAITSNPARAASVRGSGASLEALRASVPSGLVVREEQGRILTTGAVRDGASSTSAFPPGTWELVTSVPALQQAQYFVAVPTVTNAAADTFVVTTSTTAPTIWIASDPASGQSVDNIPPLAPAAFTGTYSAGAAHLTWSPNAENDLAGYKLYRGTTPGFLPSPANLVATVTTTTYDDPAAISGNYFILRAADVNGNLSVFALTQAGQVLGVGPETNVAFALQAPENPARGSSLRVAFALPAASPARLALLDVAGRKVSEREVGVLGAGRHSVDLGAGATLAPGLYMVRLEQGAAVRTARVVVLR